MLMCDECGMWQLVYATRKLKAAEIHKLRMALDDLSFSCGASLQDSEIPSELKELVYVRNMHCNEPIEKLYYSAKFEDIYVFIVLKKFRHGQKMTRTILNVMTV